MCESQRNFTIKLLPKRAARILKNTLKNLEEYRLGGIESTNSLDRDFKKKKKEVGFFS